MILKKNKNMKIKLTNPFYNFKKEVLSYSKHNKLNRIFIRRRIPFFMDGYRYASYAVKKRWGLDVLFMESGHDQVKPVWFDADFNDNSSNLWLEIMEKDSNFSKKIVNELKEILKLEKKLAKSVPNKELKPKEIEKYLQIHLDWWVKFFEIGYLWFCVENIKEKTDELIKGVWNGNQKELNHFLDTVYRPMKFPMSSIEQRDLLKLCKLKGLFLEVALKKHWNKYKHLSLHNIDDEFFDISYYKKRLKILKNDAEYNKQKEILNKADQELKEASNLIKKTKLPTSIKNKINLVRWFMYLRTETIDHMMLVNGAYKPIFNSLSKIFDLPVDAVLHMTYKEILDSLKEGKLIISRELIIDRTKNGYAYLIAPHGSYLVTGKEVDELQDIVVPKEEKKEIKELKGQIAFKGKVIGIARVILDRRNAHELKEGEILVTTMTSPEFVPAMKIASGIITNEGGVLCHAAIMSREFHKPCIIGTKIATDVIKTGQKIILDGDNGIIILN